MKLSRWFLALAFVYGGLAACPSDDDGVPDADPNDEEPDADTNDEDPDADDNDIDAEPPPEGDSGFIEDYDTEWDEFTDGWNDTGGPHDEVQIWYSDGLTDEVEDYEADDENNIEAAEGDVAVKRTRADDTEDYQVLVMTKQDDAFDPDWNNWYYEVYEQDDNDGYDLVDSGASEFEPGGNNCASCHDAQGGDNDYIAAPGSLD